MPRATQEINPVIGNILEIFGLSTPTQLAELMVQQTGLKKAYCQVLMSNIKAGRERFPTAWEESLLTILKNRGGDEAALKKLRALFSAQKMTVSPKILRALAQALAQDGNDLNVQGAVDILRDLAKIEVAGGGQTPEAALAVMATHLIKSLT